MIDPDNPNGSDLFRTSLSDFQEMIGKWCERNQVSEWDEWAWEQDIKVAETTISRIQGQYGSL